MKWLTSMMTVVGVTVALASAGQAQVVEKKALTLEAARQVMATAIGEARRLDAPGAAVAIVDDGGNLISLERLDGPSPPARTSRSARRVRLRSSSDRPGHSRTA